MDHTSRSTFSGANWSLSESTLNNTESFDFEGSILLPLELTEISYGSLICVIAYCIVFLVATSGNAQVIISLWRRHKVKQNRISLLFFHLSLADLIVCCTLIPTEIIWRLTIQWRGGNLLCKAVQSLCAFGLYLSSLILICVSVDRFLAIVFPLNVIRVKATQRNKWMLTVAWITAAVFSVPQAVFWGVESHPEYPSFKQCVTNNFLNDPKDVKIYSIFSVAVMYFLPLGVILCTYSAITVKLYRKSAKSADGSRRCRVRLSRLQSTASALSTTSTDGIKRQSKLVLRCSGSVERNMNKARARTLLMTVTIILTFVLCWSPYAAMTLWYMVDWKGAADVDKRIQDTLFLMAVANSSINPFIYRTFMHKYGKYKLCCFSV